MKPDAKFYGRPYDLDFFETFTILPSEIAPGMMWKWIFIFSVIGHAALSQVINGKIIDAKNGEPVPFASVGIIGTTRGTSSNIDGEFTLPVAGTVSLKITCVGYESITVGSSARVLLIKLLPSITQLNQIVVFSKEMNAKQIVEKAFAAVSKNYIDRPFEEKFFYRHYCKDDSVYGRLIEAFVDVWKHRGYRTFGNAAGDNEDMRVTQLRRSLDNTVMAQGHEPIAVGNVLQADVVGYQTKNKSNHISFYSDVNDLNTDIDNYSFSFKGITTYDGEEVYEIAYEHKKDSVLTTSGQYLPLTQVEGSLFITPHRDVIVKAVEERKFEGNTVRTSAYYRKGDHKYYPYHFIREGTNHHTDNTSHSFRIDLMAVETKTTNFEKFTGKEPGRDDLLKIPYDSGFWQNNTILKTTPLEEEIIRDLGQGSSLDKQFELYRQYELNVNDGGVRGAEKFQWLRDYSKGKQAMYIFFWAGDCKRYLIDVEMAKRLQARYREKMTFVFVGLDDDENLWKPLVTKYNLAANGIVNYRFGSTSDLQRELSVKETPAFFIITRQGEAMPARRPSDPSAEQELKSVLLPR